jgi:5'-methylthioadenosine phosphorylase
MTNLGEAKLCREAEICYTTCAMVTDFDSWHDTEEAVTVEMIVGNLNANAEAARSIVLNLVEILQQSEYTPSCLCQKALAQAIMTPRDHFPKETIEKLAPILKPYLETPNP